ncbi:MAG: hypothetical protein R2690_15055 [Acidimicrobiales bacterium]
MTEVLVDVGARAASSVEVVPGATPYLLISELLFAMAAVRQHPDWTAAMARRGIEGEALDRVQIDPWPPGTFDLDVERGRRLSRVIFYLRSDTEDNGYARPIEGVMAHVDLATAEVLEIVDTGVVPVPEARHSYYPEHQGPLRDDLRPIHVTQPDGPSFSVEGNLVHWQRWQVRVSMDQVEGLVLHDLAYADPARRRAAPGAAPCRAVGDGRPVRPHLAVATVEERLRRRRVGPRSHGQLADAGL